MVDKKTLTEEDIKRLFITKPLPRQDGQTTR